MRAIGVAICLVSLCSAGVADDFGIKKVVDRNATFELRQLGFPADNTLVSGTNVCYTPVASVHVTQNEPIGESDWTIGFVTKLQVWIGNTKVKEFVEDPNGRIGRVGYESRFASTWFPNQTPLPLKIVASCVLIRYNIGGTTQMESKVITDEEFVITVIPYNRALQLATVEEFDRENRTFYVPEALGTVGTVARKGVDATRLRLAAIKHLMVPGNYAGESTLREAAAGDPPVPGLSALLKESTVFVAFTHGIQGGGFRASHTDNLFWGEVEDYVNAGRSVPGHNFVAAYICREGTAMSGAPQFRITGSDRAYAGFTSPASELLYEDPSEEHADWTLDRHASRVFELLRDGATIGEALGIANGEFLPQTTSGNPMPMQLLVQCGVPDPYTRMHLVYLNQVERDALDGSGRSSEKNLWYYISEIAQLPP